MPARIISNSDAEFSPYAVGVAAEAFAAGLLAHAGYDVSVQYGANRPHYDLIAVKPNRVLQVSVKGSKDGGWGLSQGYKAGRTYAQAADEWLRRQPGDLVFMLVQFQDTPLGSCPDAYVARPKQIADALKHARNGLGQTLLSVQHRYSSGAAKGYTDRLPALWKFSQHRIDTV